MLFIKNFNLCVALTLSTLRTTLEAIFQHWVQRGEPALNFQGHCKKNGGNLHLLLWAGKAVQILRRVMPTLDILARWEA